MTLETLLTHPSVEALGRALLHFLWQGSLLALTLWVVKTITPASAARVRYAAAGFIMLMVWVYFLSLILLVGAETDRIIEGRPRAGTQA